jgi:hypothetical protein
VRRATLEERRIQQELERLRQETGASDFQSVMAVKKLVYDKQVEEAKLIHLYFDRLRNGDPPQRDLAFIALSSFVGPEIIERLALGGESLVSRSGLSRLAALGKDAAADAAQNALNADAIEYKSRSSSLASHPTPTRRWRRPASSASHRYS